jgi:hypothetical protein
MAGRRGQGLRLSERHGYRPHPFFAAVTQIGEGAPVWIVRCADHDIGEPRVVHCDEGDGGDALPGLESGLQLAFSLFFREGWRFADDVRECVHFRAVAGAKHAFAVLNQVRAC